MRSLLHHCPFVPGIPVHDHWTNVLPWILDVLLQQMYPLLHQNYDIII